MAAGVQYLRALQAAGWAQTADGRRKRIAARRLPITGVSEFPNLTETLPTREPWIVPPPAVDWAADFEAMREEPAAAEVFVATLGPVAEHSARAGFVTNLLAAGGIRSTMAGRTDAVADLVAAYRDEQVVVLAGADTAYATWGPAAIAALRTAGAGTIILAGRPVPEVAELVDDHVAVGQDVVDFLRRLRAQLSGEVVRT
jgi:methylmalonyl-CoA mutase